MSLDDPGGSGGSWGALEDLGGSWRILEDAVIRQAQKAEVQLPGFLVQSVSKPSHIFPGELSRGRGPSQGAAVPQGG